MIYLIIHNTVVVAIKMDDKRNQILYLDQGIKVKLGAYIVQRLACGAHIRLLGPWAWGRLLLRPG